MANLNFKELHEIGSYENLLRLARDKACNDHDLALCTAIAVRQNEITEEQRGYIYIVFQSTPKSDSFYFYDDRI